MKKIYPIFVLIILIAGVRTLDAKVYYNASGDVYTRYIFRGFTPAGNQPAAALNFSAFFSEANINVSQWFINSLSDVSAYHESGTMVNYYHYLTDRIIISGGLTAYLFPDVANTSLFNMELNLAFSDVGFVIPYFIETYFDVVVRSWYLKFTGGYNFDAFLPVSITLSNGINLLSYTRRGNIVKAGFSDLELQLGTYMRLKNWQINPKLSYIIPLNTSVNQTTMLQATVNVGYAF